MLVNRPAGTKSINRRSRADVHDEPATGEPDQARNWFAPRSSGAGIVALCVHLHSAGACCSSGKEQSARCLASSATHAGDRNRSRHRRLRVAVSAGDAAVAGRRLGQDPSNQSLQQLTPPLETVNLHPQAKAVRITTGTIVDATGLNAQGANQGKLSSEIATRRADVITYLYATWGEQYDRKATDSRPSRRTKRIGTRRYAGSVLVGCSV